MGWNDRLPEDPYWPSHYDAEAYEEWHKYLVACQNGEIEPPENSEHLSSQNVDPALLPTTDQETNGVNEPRETVDDSKKKPAEVSIVERPGGCAAQQ